MMEEVGRHFTTSVTIFVKDYDRLTKQTNMHTDKSTNNVRLFYTFNYQRHPLKSRNSLLVYLTADASGYNRPDTTTLQTFYCPFSGTTRVSQCQKRTSGHHSIQTSQCQPPPNPHIFTGQMPFLPPTNSVKALKATTH